jgi:hypothetical protein
LRKGTIFKYELKRLLISKEYLLLLAVTLAYAVSLLRGIVTFGANFTAPFSRPTFGAYCTSLAPFLFILLLVLCARQSKASERGAESIISATPIPLHIFRLLRYGAVACAFLVAAALPVTACFLFYRLVFDYTVVGNLFWLGLLLLLPPAVLLFGAAMFFGRRRTAVIYVLLAAVLIVSVFRIPLPAVLDIMGDSAAGPFHGGATADALAPAFIAGRAVFLGIGIVCIIASLFQPKRSYNR